MARILTYTQALGMAEEPWAVAGVLGGVGVLWGEAGIGKSFVAVSIAASVATGYPWLGHPVTEGPVVYVAGEGGAGAVAHRLDAALAALRCCDPDGPPPPIWIVVPGVNLVAGPSELMALVGDVARPVLVIIDTLSRCFIGDENGQDEMGRFVQSLDFLRDLWGASILVLHHANREGRVRGSSVLYGAVDVSLRLSPGAKAGEWRIMADKLRDRDVTAPAAEFRFEQVTSDGVDEMGDARTTRVIRPTAAFELMVVRVAAAAPQARRWTYLDWRRACPDYPKEPFDRAVTAVVGDPEIWGIVGADDESGGFYRRVE